MLLPAQAELAARIAAEWLGEHETSVKEVAKGASNAVYATGEGRYLRRYRRLDHDAVLREHALIEHVRTRGIPAPRLFTREGSSVYVASDGGLWAAFDAADGVQHDAPSEAQLFAAGKMLAQLHAASASFALEVTPSHRLAWDGAAWSARVAKTAARVPRSHDETDRWALARAEAQARWLADAACLHSYEPHFPSQIVHGDYTAHNLFFSGDQVSAVIDWENATLRTRAYELARTCFFVCEMQREGIAALLAGYRAVTPLDDEELDDGVAAFAVYADHHVWPLEQLYLHQNRAASCFIWRRPFRAFQEEWRSARA